MSFESHVKKYDETGQNVVTNLPSELELKMCSVKIRKLSINFKEESSSSDDELPPPTFLLSAIRSTRKSRKSSKDLKEEFENLAKDITADNLCENNIEEKLRRMEVVEDSFEVEEEESLSPPPTKEEEKEFKIFCVTEYLQYFNCMNITLLQCGYGSSWNHTHYEKELLLSNRVELEHILCSFLYSYNVHSVSDCKSFVSYLLKNLSVHTDVGCVEACYRVLELLLQKHPDANKLTFSSAEIFMLVFNYGIDIHNFKILPKKSDFLDHLDKPTFKCKSSSKVPQSWIINLTFLLDAIMCLFEICIFNAEDLGFMAIMFLYMTLDCSLIKENVLPNKLICESLDLIPKNEWPKIMNTIASTFISMEFSSFKEKWSNILQIAQSLPASSVRGLELRKYISFLSLKHLGKDKSVMKGSEVTIEKDLSETSNICKISELEALLECILIDKMDPELISFGVKFLDICISHLKATDEDFEKLCNILKRAESALNEQAYEARAHFVKMHARMKIHLGKNSFYKVAPEKKLTIKKEFGAETEDVSCSLDFVKVKTEPGLESTTPCMVENDVEKLIRLSDFNCDNDYAELDFDSIGKDISSTNAVKTEKIMVTDQTISTDSTNLNVSQNFEELNTENISENNCLTEDNMGDLPVIASTYSASTHVENNDAVSSNSVLSNPPLFKSGISVSVKVEPIETEMPKLSVIESPILDVANYIGQSVLASDNTLASSIMDTTICVESEGSEKINDNNELADNCVAVLQSDLSCGFTSNNQTDSGKSPKLLDPMIINVDQVSDVTLLAKSLHSSNNLVQESGHSIQTDMHPDAVFLTAISSVGNQTESGKSSKQLDSVIINIDQALNDVSPENNFSDHSEPIGSRNLDTGFSPAVGNQPDDLAHLVESLALPKGTEISPIKTDAIQTDSTKQRKSSMPHLPGVASGEISMTVIEDEVIIVDEVASPTKPKKSKKHQVLESNDSDLIILFSKPVVRSSKSKKKSGKVHQDKLSSSKSSDEDVTILTDFHNNSDEKDSSTTITKVTGSDNFPSASLDSKSNNISDDEGVVFICHVDSPSKSKISNPQNVEIASKDLENLSVINSPSRKCKDSKSVTFPSSNRSLSGDDLNKLIPSEANIFPPESDQVVSLDSGVQLQTTVQNDLEIIDSEVAAVMNEGILKNFIDLVNDPGTSDFQSEKRSNSFDQNALNKEGHLKNIDAQKEDSNNISVVEEDPVKMFFVEEGIFVSEMNKDTNTDEISAKNCDFQNEDSKKEEPSEDLFVEDVSEVNRHGIEKVGKTDVKNSEMQNKNSEESNLFNKKSDKTLYVENKILVSAINADKYENIHKMDAKNKDLTNNDSEKLVKKPSETFFVEDGMLVSEINENKSENSNEVDAENCDALNKNSEKNNLLNEKPESFFVEGEILEPEVDEDKSEKISKTDSKNGHKEKQDSEKNEKPAKTYFVEGGMLVSEVEDKSKNISKKDVKNCGKEKQDSEKNENSAKTYFVERGMLVSEVENKSEKISKKDAKNGFKEKQDSEKNEKSAKTYFVEGGMLLAEVSKGEPEKNTKLGIKNSNIQIENPEKNSFCGKPETFFFEEGMLVQEINKDKPENINKTLPKSSSAQNKDSEKINSLNEKTAQTFFVEEGMLVSEDDKDKPKQVKVDIKKSDRENKGFEKFSMSSENPCKTFFVEGGIFVSENIKSKTEEITEIGVKNANFQKRNFEKVSTLHEKPAKIFLLEGGKLVPEDNNHDKVGNTHAKNSSILNNEAEENSLLGKKWVKTDVESGQLVSNRNKMNAKNIVAHKEDFVQVSMKIQLDEIITKVSEKAIPASEVDQNKFENSNEINAQDSNKKEFEPSTNLKNKLSPKAKKSFKRKFVHEVFENESSRREKLLKDSDRQSGESDKLSVLKDNLDKKDKSGKMYKINTVKGIKVIKKFLKRKSVDEDIENKRLKTEGNVGIEDDVSCVLNNLLESSVEINSDCVDKSLYHSASCDKSPLSSRVNNCIQEPDYDATNNIKNDRPQTTLIECNENQTNAFQYKSSRNFLNLNALIDSKKSKESNPRVKTKIFSRGNGAKSCERKHQKKERIHLKVEAQRSRKSSELSGPENYYTESPSPSVNQQKYAATDDLQLLKIAKRTKSPLKFSPRKSSLSPKSLKSRNSPSKYFDYRQKRSNYCAFNKIKKTDLLTQTGLNLKNILREKIQPQTLPSHFHQNSFQTESYVISDSDSDVMELYCDPKRYRDKECLIIYESEDQIVID